MKIRSLHLVVLAVIFSTVLLFTAPESRAADPALTPEQGKAMIAENKNLVILDVRNPNEYVVAHYPDALNIPVTELKERLGEVPADKTVLIHCAKGKRAARAYAVFQEDRPGSIANVYFIKGEPLFD